MSLPVVKPETAFSILHKTRNRQNVPGADNLVNVCGKVTCVSEVVKIKDSLLFMVKFIPNVDIIIKRKECLQWQEQLSPYKEYIFTELRPTSLQKGSRSPQRVFTVTKNSKLLLPDGVDVKFVTTSDWLKQYDLQSALDDTCNVNMQDSITDNLFSYQGKVTAVLDQGLGVVELDNTLRLYVGPVPAAHKFSMLKEGTTVLVQNAHFTTSKQYPRVTMYCCMLTSVKCMDHPIEKAGSVRLSQTLQKLLYLEGQSQTQMDQMFILRQVLRKQFLDTLGERVTEKIFSAVMGNAELIGVDSDRKVTRKGPQRILIDEFLLTPHNCPLQKAEKVHLSLRTTEEVKDSICDISSETMEWQHVRQLPMQQQVILGILRVGETIGQVLLHDDTGSIEIVTSCYHGNGENRTECDHICTGTCDCDKTNSGDKFPCPYVHTCCLGKIVALTAYEMVSETMVTRNACVLKGLNNRDRSRSKSDKYLILDMRKVIYIGHTDSAQPVKTDNKCPNINMPSNSCSDRLKNASGRSEARQNGGTVQDSHLNAVRTYSRSNSLNTEMAKCKVDTEKGMQSISEGKFDFDGVDKNNTEQRTSTLHKHVRADRTTMFCRKVECCGQAVIKKTETEVCQSTNWGSVGTSDSEVELCKENAVHDTNRESANSSFLKYELGKTAFKVKPVSHRKRSVLEACVDSPDDTELNKIPRTDLKKELGIDKEVVMDMNTEVLQNKACPDRNFDFKSVCDGTRDVIVYVENKGSLMAEGKQLRFSMECTVLKKEGHEKLVLEFSGISVKWYPVLYPSMCYKLFVCTEDGPVLGVGLVNDKLTKVLQKSKARRCLIVNEKVCMREIWNVPLQSCGLIPASVTSIQDILKLDFTQKFVNFEGWIINRTLVKPGFASKSVSKDIGAGAMYSRLHVQDASRREDIWVYLNDSNILSERGLVPGSRVRFYGLERKLSQLNNIYCRLVPLSSVQILCMEAERDVTKHLLDQSSECDNQQLPVLYLVDLWSPLNAGQVFQSICDIEKILKVSLKCLCETCGSFLLGSTCSNTACNGGGAYRFLARASAIIDDSTSVGMVTLTGSSVQSMLQLSHDQWKCLEEEVSQSGEVFVQQFNPTLCTSLERFVYKLCDNHAVKQTWFMTLKTRSSLDISKIGHDEFCMKSFDTGSSRISTQCLPFLQLECLAMKLFEPSLWSVHHLSMK